MENNRRPKIGLALGGGGAKGLTHIGVIKVLEENNIPIDFIAGSSIGALIGGIYAATKDIKKIENFTLSSNWRQIAGLVFDPAIRGGLISGRKIELLLRNQINRKQFSELLVPFVAVATDLETGQTVAIRDGDVVSAIRASISVPLIFRPVELGGRLLVDGGLSEPVPVKTVKEMGADLTIAVNLNSYLFLDGGRKKANFYMIAHQAVDILRHHLISYGLQTADLVVSPEVKISGIIGWREFLKSQKFISAGEQAMRLFIPKLKELINSR